MRFDVTAQIQERLIDNGLALFKQSECVFGQSEQSSSHPIKNTSKEKMSYSQASCDWSVCVCYTVMLPAVWPLKASRVTVACTATLLSMVLKARPGAATAHRTGSRLLLSE